MRPMRCIYARCGIFVGMASSCRRAPCARQGAGTHGVMFSLAWLAPVGGRHASDALHLRAV